MRRTAEQLSARIRHAVRVALRRVGIAVHRVRPPGPPPPLFDDPLAALHVARGGKPAAFLCPLAQCVAFNGFTFGADGWHPFVMAAGACGAEEGGAYEDSVLETFYERWQPANAAEALIGCDGAAVPALAQMPSWGYLFPWNPSDPEEHAAEQRANVEHANRTLGQIDLPITAGYNHHGPVAPLKGAMEHDRLSRLHRSLAATGYDRKHGDIVVTLLKRGIDRRYLVVSGHHRSAVASALGFQAIPAVFAEPRVVDLQDVDYWPQVRLGRWPREAAVRYFGHLFDFDAPGWARQRGLPHWVPSVRPVRRGVVT
jgi:hypothetical protein